MTFGVGSGAAGTVTLGSNISISNLSFAAAGSGTYTIAGSGTYALTLLAVGSKITTDVAATISAPLAGSGSSLVKTGTATLTLAGANTYSGGTTINVGKLTVGALTLSNTASAIFDLSSGTVYDQLVANGNVALGGASLTLNVPANAAFTVGQTLVLIHSTGTLSGTFTGIDNMGIYTYGGNSFEAFYTGTDFDLLTTATSVPEPATWLGGALLLVGVSARLRRWQRGL